MSALLALVLLAQPAVPAPAADEGPAEVQARVRYERAIRAEFDGRRDDAVREAQACLAAEPQGRFAAASRSLIERLQGQVSAPVRSTGVGPRTELVISATLTGLYLSSLAAAATDAGEKGTVAWLMVGTGGALAGSIIATSNARVPQSMPQMLQNGVGYGTWAGLIGQTIANGKADSVGVVAAAAGGGAVAGLVASPFLTGGDSGAMTNAMIYGGAIPTAIVYIASGNKSADKTYEWTALVGSTAGIAVGPLLNGQLHWSRGRWNLVTLGGFVGALMGGGLAVLTDATGQGAAALGTTGAVGGLLLTGWLTNDFGADEPRPGSALLHFEDGKLTTGNAMTALTPTRLHDKPGAALSLVDGRF